VKKSALPVSRKFSTVARFWVEMAVSRHSYLRASGWWNSVLTGQCVGAQGEALPWITYPCIKFLEERVGPEMAVFEFGSGNSTLWWATRVAKVISCEDDPAWYQRMKSALPANAALILADAAGGEYANTIFGHQSAFDIVVIDGSDRVMCASNALGALKDDGIIIWDNSDRAEYVDGFRMLASQGFRRLDFAGMAPLVMFESVTSIFYRQRNCLAI
jgi:hypothetical protein